jgi:hypothetical protein
MIRKMRLKLREELKEDYRRRGGKKIKLMREMRFNTPRTDSAEEMEHYMKYFLLEKETGYNTKRAFIFQKFQHLLEKDPKEMLVITLGNMRSII